MKKNFMNVLPSYFPGIKCLILQAFMDVVVTYLCSVVEHNHSLRHDSGIFCCHCPLSLTHSLFLYSLNHRRVFRESRFVAFNTPSPMARFKSTSREKRIDIYLQFPCQNMNSKVFFMFTRWWAT